MPKPPAGAHWKDKIQSGNYLCPAGRSKIWKERYEELYTTVTKTKLIKPEEMPWINTRYMTNPFVSTRFTGRYLWLKLMALFKMKYIKLHYTPDEDVKEGFFGIICIEIPTNSANVFNASPMTLRELFKDNPDAQKKELKTNDRCWKTYGWVQSKRKNAAGAFEIQFQMKVAETIGHQNSRNKHKKITLMNVEETPIMDVEKDHESFCEDCDDDDL